MARQPLVGKRVAKFEVVARNGRLAEAKGACEAEADQLLDPDDQITWNGLEVAGHSAG